MKKTLLMLLSKIGLLLKKTYKFQDNSYSNLKYLYFFFYQRILMFNVFIPWPVHYTSYITSHKNITFGEFTSPGSSPFQYIQGEGGIHIGNNVQLAPGVQLISANHKHDDFHQHLKSEPIKIDDNVWVGANTVILPEVHIGENVIIGACSVVTKNIPANSIAVGNPCRVIKKKAAYKAHASS